MKRKFYALNIEIAEKDFSHTCFTSVGKENCVLYVERNRNTGMRNPSQLRVVDWNVVGV